MSAERVFVTWGHNPPLTREETVAHLQHTSDTLGAAGIPMIIVTQEPKGEEGTP